MSSVPIYVGRWQDYSQKSSALGDVITLDVQTAGYLIAALSTFVAYVGSASFSLIAFIVHRCLVKDEQSDLLTVQFRILFRSPSSPISTIEEIMKLFWAWHKLSDGHARVEMLKRRSLYLVLPPLLIFAGFTIAGVFVSNVAGTSYTSNNVRVNPLHCGSFVYNNTPEGNRAMLQKVINDTLAGRAYVDNCYGQNTNVAQCSLFPTQAIPYSTTAVPCPFGTDDSGKSLCLYNQSQALQIDTGLLDTNDILGINAVPQNRVLFLKRLTCSPINVTSYIDIDNSTSPIQLLNLGPIYNISSYTYSYHTQLKSVGIGYLVFSIPANPELWTPIDALKVPNGDVSVNILVSNSIRYVAPVEDIWFSATTPINPGSGLPVEYVADADVTVMGCVDTLQLCNPTPNPLSCTIISDWLDISQAYGSIGLNDYQYATAQRLMALFADIASFDSINALGDNALYARRNVYESISTGLPTDQWQTEVRGWFETLLAKLQAAVIEQVTNIADMGPYGVVVSPDPNGSSVERAAANFCDNQRVRNTGGYQTFSLLGLMVVICIGASIIIISWAVEPIFKALRWCVRRCVRRHTTAIKRDDDADIVRVADGTLQLLKMALWGAGYTEGWERRLKSAPVTNAGTIFTLPKYMTTEDGIEDCRYEKDTESSSFQQHENREENADRESADTRLKTGNGTVVEIRVGDKNEREDGDENKDGNMNTVTTGRRTDETANNTEYGSEATSGGHINEPANDNT